MAVEGRERVKKEVEGDFKRKLEDFLDGERMMLVIRKKRLEELKKQMEQNLVKVEMERIVIEKRLETVMGDWVMQAMEVEQVVFQKGECGICFERFQKDDLVSCAKGCAGRMCVPCSMKLEKDKRIGDIQCPFCRGVMWVDEDSD